MKLILATLALTFTFGALASEIDNFDACGHYQSKVSRLERELNELYSESRKYNSESSYGSSSSEENCEEPMDHAGYISRQIEHVRKNLLDARRSVSDYCRSDYYP